MSINRPELFEMMGVPKAQASKMLDLVLNSITEALAKGEDVTPAAARLTKCIAW